MNEIQNSLLETMRAFTKATSATTTVTIEGRIVNIIDAGKKEYEVEYQGNTFAAHAISEVNYKVNDIVYLLIPNGDFSKNKIILGLVNSLDKVFVSETDYDDSIIRQEISDNLIDRDFGVIKLSSYEDTKVENQNITNFPLVNFNKIFQEYFNKYKNYKLSFSTKTELDLIQQSGGNYGVSLKIPLIENAAVGGGQTGQIWKVINLDVENMLGNPYRFEDWSPQAVYFSIGEQFIYDSTRVPILSYYCRGFSQDSNKRDIKDIFLKDISLNAVDLIEDKDTNGYKLVLRATEGQFFSAGLNSHKAITPILRVNGRTTNLENSQIYWFIEDAEITNEDKAYSVYGGYGWRCLNSKTNIAVSADGTETYDYVTTQQSFDVEQEKVKGNARYKCAVVRNGIQTSAIITLKNLEATRGLKIVSSTGTDTFLKDTGYVELSVYTYIKDVTNIEDNRAAVIYSWMLQHRYAEKNWYETIEYNKMENAEMGGVIVPCYKTTIKIPANKLEEFNNILCSAKYVKIAEGRVVEELVGTDTFIAKTAADLNFSLSLENDGIIYKYDTNGNSPMSTNYNGPTNSKVSAIKPISFTIRKSSGEELTKDEYCYVKYTWVVPKSSMFIVRGAAREDNENYYFTGYDTYNHTANLSYSLANRYSISKAEKRVKLKVEFQGITLEKEVQASFLKEGMNGTNGTNYSAEIVATGLNANTSVPYSFGRNLRLIYRVDSGQTLYYDYITQSFRDWNFDPRRFHVRMYNNGERAEAFSVEYSIFDKNNTNPCLQIAEVGADKGVRLSLTRSPQLNENTCNILQAKIIPADQNSVANAQQILYCYYPIEILVTNAEPAFFKDIVKGGFSEVMYSSDGTNPMWNEEEPFSCGSEFFNLEWSGIGHIKPAISNEKVFKAKPDNKYDDGNSLNLVKLNLSLKEDKVAEITQLISNLENNNRWHRDYINWLNTNYQWLTNFANSYNEREWLQRIDRIKVLFDNRTVSAYRLNTLLNTSLVNLDVFINTHSPVAAELSNQLSNVKREAERALVEVKRIQDFNQLVSLENISIPWNESIKNNYIGIYGLDATIALQCIIEDVNRNLEEYRISYRSLISLTPQLLTQELQEIKNSIRNMCNQIPDNAISTYVDIKRKCLAYLDLWETQTSIVDIKKSIRDIYNNVLRGIFILGGGQLKTSAATDKEFNDTKRASEEKISDNNRLLGIYRSVLNTRGKSATFIRPIIMYYNRYEMSNLNAWDGNKIETGDGSYLLAPQVGAGLKENDNSFTGLVMGLKNIGTGATAANQVGLFGYSKGRQSIKLDARSGSAVFGVAGNAAGGQVVIDPDNGGLLYSSNYWRNYNTRTGMPSSYLDGNKSGNGMLLNLKESKIHLGSAADGVIYSGGHLTLQSTEQGFFLSQSGLSIGKGFVVASDGTATANKNGGNLGGWRIRTDNNGEGGFISRDGTGILLDSNSSTVALGAASGKVYSGGHTSLESPATGFYLSNNGLSIVGNDAEGNRNKFAISTGGDPQMYTGRHNYKDSVERGYYIGADGLSIGSSIRINAEEGGTAFLGNLRSGNKYWTINGNASNASITYGERGRDNSVSLRTDELTLGSKFYVNAADGSMRLGNGAVEGNRKHWIVNTLGEESYIAYGTNRFNDSSGVYVGTDGIRLGRYFNVDSRGNLEASSGIVGGWEIEDDAISSGNIRLQAGGSITHTGGRWEISQNGSAYFKDITANTGGTIGGWQIRPNGLFKDGIELRSDGSLRSNNWSIAGNGNARFNNITCNGTWDFGNGNNKWTNSGFTFNTGQLGNNTVTDQGFGFTRGTVGLGNVGSGSSHISYSSGGDVSVGGTIYAKAGVIGGCSINNGVLTVGRANITSVNAEALYFQGSPVSWNTVPLISDLQVSGTLYRQIQLLVGGRLRKNDDEYEFVPNTRSLDLVSRVVISAKKRNIRVLGSAPETGFERVADNFG